MISVGLAFDNMICYSTFLISFMKRFYCGECTITENNTRLTDLIFTDFIPLGFFRSFCDLLDSEGFDKVCLTLSTTTPAQIEYQDLPTLPLVDKHNPTNFDNHTK